MLLYSGQYHCNLDPYDAQKMYATDAVKEQKKEQCNIAYMDVTWVWRYHSMKKGVAPKVSVKGGVQSAKGERLIGSWWTPSPATVLSGMIP